MTIATLGVFILLIGWFGFNPGSVLAFTGESNTILTVVVAVNTLLAACAGAFLAMVTSALIGGKPDIGYALNGMLAGLVGITANADLVTNAEAIVIGAVAGPLVVGAMLLLEKLKIDDPVGAFPVHGACGIWGGIATAIFGGASFGVQVLGSIAYASWAFVAMFAIFSALKAIGWLRVSEVEETEGLDIGEHGAIGYPEFVSGD